MNQPLTVAALVEALDELRTIEPTCMVVSLLAWELAKRMKRPPRGKSLRAAMWRGLWHRAHGLEKE